MTTQLGKGGHGGGHGGGHHHGGFTHWGQRPGRYWGGWGPGWADEIVPSYGIDVDQMLAASEVADQAQTQGIAHEVLKHLKAGATKVGEGIDWIIGDSSDLDVLDSDMLGEDSDKKSGGLFGDFGISSLLQTGGKLAETGINIYQKDQADKAASGAEQARLQSAIRADAQATAAAVRADLSAQLSAGAPTDASKKAKAAADASTATTMAAMQAAAGAGLSPASQAVRLQSAQDALSRASDLLSAHPDNAAYAAQVAAWNKTLAKIASGGGALVPAASGDVSKGRDDESWWAGSTGPVPNKYLVGGGAVVAGLLVLRGLLR